MCRGDAGDKNRFDGAVWTGCLPFVINSPGTHGTEQTGVVVSDRWL